MGRGLKGSCLSRYHTHRRCYKEVTRDFFFFFFFKLEKKGKCCNSSLGSADKKLPLGRYFSVGVASGRAHGHWLITGFLGGPTMNRLELNLRPQAGNLTHRPGRFRVFSAPVTVSGSGTPHPAIRCSSKWHPPQSLTVTIPAD